MESVDCLKDVCGMVEGLKQVRLPGLRNQDSGLGRLVDTTANGADTDLGMHDAPEDTGVSFKNSKENAIFSNRKFIHCTTV